jgi:lambda repressor-like predicted transcriptional regulator
MLPASTFAEITTNIAALQLDHNTATAVLGAILAPLLRAQTETQAGFVEMTKPSRLPRSNQRRKKAKRHAAARRRVKANPEPRDAPRQRAIAALRDHPGATLTQVAKIAKVSRSTVHNAAARKPSRGTSVLAKQDERRQRAQRFLRDELARGPKRVSDVEEAAGKAHIDVHTLQQARSDLGIVTSRPGNTGGGNTLSVQWSLPG